MASKTESSLSNEQQPPKAAEKYTFTQRTYRQLLDWLPLSAAAVCECSTCSGIRQSQWCSENCEKNCTCDNCVIAGMQVEKCTCDYCRVHNWLATETDAANQAGWRLTENDDYSAYRVFAGLVDQDHNYEWNNMGIDHFLKTVYGKDFFSSLEGAVQGYTGDTTVFSHAIEVAGCAARIYLWKHHVGELTHDWKNVDFGGGEFGCWGIDGDLY